ncbi:hypothetical protein OOK13_33825 [Streptomyces sp. NBC_00378]|uniref:hypothetical protein n=1 Tax=unclassified Streptomyces TaxID=2593676 RepID=UPI00225083DE|nr:MULTISPECIES: hypothetical protein [unclassified Streptomyces]MCX5113350.1 hypothetical protein [Streptomyces sp. NBC_00378]
MDSTADLARDGRESPLRWCPSGDASRPESVVLGVRSGEHDQVAYLAEPVPAADVLGSIPEGIAPNRVLRFASHCVSDCANRVGEACGLIERITTVPAEPGPAAVPRCHLRPHCKWWNQVGVEACHRCPALTTLEPRDDELAVLVADPATTREQLENWIAAAQ